MKPYAAPPRATTGNPLLRDSTSPGPSRPDAETHARILMESRSRREALLIAQTNASLGRSAEYWSQVLLAVFHSGYSAEE